MRYAGLVDQQPRLLIWVAKLFCLALSMHIFICFLQRIADIISTLWTVPARTKLQSWCASELLQLLLANGFLEDAGIKISGPVNIFPPGHLWMRQLPGIRWLYGARMAISSGSIHWLYNAVE